jgi:hypothetical protein
MRAINLTAKEYRTITSPTRKEQWGASAEVARKVQAQAMRLVGEIEVDQFDVAAINSAARELRFGTALADPFSGGWNGGAGAAIISAAEIKRVFECWNG